MTTDKPYRDETEAERLDRQLAELLQELRVILPGVQVLFAFLLTVPFSARFEEVTDTQRGVYVGVLLATALATILLMAPTALHRLRFRQHRKREIVDTAQRFTLAGLAVLAARRVGRGIPDGRHDLRAHGRAGGRAGHDG